MKIGDRYNWKGQPERLVYVGRTNRGGFWHQFEKVGEPGVVWCEVQEKDLDKMEETEGRYFEPMGRTTSGAIGLP